MTVTNKKMNCSNNQCCAPTVDNKRCPNSVINGANHCKNHLVYAKGLYDKYKKICNIAYNLDIEKDIHNVESHHNHLMQCYVWLNKAFTARMRHRKYAFVPECYDEGHNMQFEIIQKKIDVCEKKLMEICPDIKNENTDTRIQLYIPDYQNYYRELILEDNTDSDESNEFDDNDDFDMACTQQKISECKNKRGLMEREIDNVMDKYMKENSLVLEWRSKIISFIFAYIEKLFESVPAFEDNAFVFCVAIHNLVRELHHARYFSKNYKPEKCVDCKCNNFISYYLRLGCGCVFSNSTIPRYFNLMSTETLKRFYEVLLLNKDKIKPFVNDLNFHYTLFDDNMLFMHMELVWNQEKQRLALSQAAGPPYEKRSKLLASLRKRGN